MYEVPRVVKFVETESRMGVARIYRDEGFRVTGKVLAGGNEKFWRRMAVMVTQ